MGRQGTRPIKAMVRMSPVSWSPSGLAASCHIALRANGEKHLLSAVNQDVVRFLRVRWSSLAFRGVETECALLRPSGSFPAVFASMMCLRNASLSRKGRSLVFASVRGSLGIAESAQQARRLFGPKGGSGRQDVLYVAEGEGGKGSS